MAGPTMLDLVHNGTMNGEVASLLWAIAEEQHTFVVVAVPRFAGKSTVTQAMLRFVPEGIPLHYLSGDEAEMEQLAQRPDGGYLVVGEFSRAPVPTYIWGPPVRKVFETMRAGFSLCTALHAPSVEDAYGEICRSNRVPDEDASRIDYMVYIERMGTRLDNFWRRIAGIYEVDRVVDGAPQARLLYRWVVQGDRFEQVEQPELLTVSPDVLRERGVRIQEAADAGRTTEADVAALAQH